jgi:uncharacterized protein
MKFERGIHFLPITYSSEIGAEYLPSDLRHEDYPDLIPVGQTIQTIADEVVLIGYNWPKNSDRYRRVQKFVEAFFPKIEDFRKPQFHPKWREVNLAVRINGWNRFEPAEEWLKTGRNPDPEKTMQALFPQYTASRSATGDAALSAQANKLFQEFLKWQQSQQPAR